MSLSTPACATAADARVERVESGSGPAVLFIPGSYSTPAAWRPLQRFLPPKWRLIGTSLCGYGATDETRSLDDHGMAHELRVVERALQGVEGPVHLVAHSFGGSVALAAALHRVVPVASLALFEANPLALLQHGGHEPLHAETWRMSRDFESAHHAGERDAAARIIDFWGHAGAFAEMPAAVQDYCRRTTASNVLDWRTGFGFDITPADLERLDVPVLLVRGALANPAMRAVTAVLAARLPKVRPAVVDGAGHFLITSHVASCAELLDDFLAQGPPGRDDT